MFHDQLARGRSAGPKGQARIHYPERHRPSRAREDKQLGESWRKGKTIVETVPACQLQW